MNPHENDAPLRVALLQAVLAWEDAATNEAHFDARVHNLLFESSSLDLLVLPEMWATGFTMNPHETGMTWKDTWAKDVNRWPAPLQAMHRWSVQSRAACVGSLACVLEEANRCVNRCFFVTPDGTLHWYDKKHLFGFAGESNSYSPGQERQIVTWRGWNILLQVCYDLRFPVFSRNRKEAPYDIALYVANWPEPRREAWLTLLSARAIENQSYVIGVNRVGVDGNGISHSGDSAIFHPKGNVLLQIPAHQERSETWALSSSDLLAFRAKFPVLKDGDAFEM